MSRRSFFCSHPFLGLCCAVLLTSVVSDVHGEAYGEEGGYRAWGPVVKREQRRTLVSTENGEISAVRVTDNINGSYLLHFFTLDPNSLLLPVVLHADMVFYVHTGSGKLSWTEEDELKSTDLTRGDVYRVEQGSVFFIQSNLETETERQKLRIHAIFVNSNNDLHEPITGPYSSIREMVLGFDRKVLQAAFKVPEDVIEELFNGANPPAIVHAIPKTKKAVFDMEAQFIRSLLGSTGYNYNIFELNKKKKKSSAKLFNLFKEDKDFENCNGWSTTVTRKKLSALKGSDIGLFMVNLTTGSMMGPHWNPTATEIGVVLQGRGMIRVVCSSISNETGCRNARFQVEEGDVFAVPRFHPMAQISFNNETLVFMGFSTTAKKNHPQFLAGQASVFRSLDRDVLAMSFNITNTTLDQLLAPQHESVILGCVSCADEELRIMEEEMERKREEAREREEEEAKRREEERRREEEEAREREEEKARKEEEERRKREEAEARRREEEAEREKREEEERQREEEARREEEERRKKEEAAEARAREEEEERARREEEERQREEEEAKRREEEEGQREREEEAARREEEERIRRQEEQRQREEEEAAARQREKEEQEEEAKRSEQEQEEEEARRRHQEEERQKEEEARRREEEAAARREEEEARQREKEEQARRRHHEGGEEEREGEGEGEGKSEGERAAEEERRREEEAQREEQEARERERHQGGGGGGDEGENRGRIRWGRVMKKRLTV